MRAYVAVLDIVLILAFAAILALTALSYSAMPADLEHPRHDGPARIDVPALRNCTT